MRSRITLALAAGLAAGMVPATSFAQSVTPGELDQAGRLGEQLLREQQQIEMQRRLERERARQQPSGERLPEAEARVPEAEAAEGPCREVAALEIVGARLLPEKTLAQIKTDTVGRCLTAKDLNSLLRRVTDAYVALGYVTTRAYVPPQSAGDGTLTLVVIEGTIERIEIEPSDRISVATAFPGMVGNVFNLRDAEQGLEQINRLGANDARLDIRPGSAPGSSVLVIANNPGRRITGSLSSDNTGSPETGEWQGGAVLSADGLAGLNDGFLLTHNRSLDDPTGPGASYSTSLSWSVPYGWWTGTLSLSESNYHSLVEGITRDFVTSGTSRNFSLRVDRVAWRDQTRKLTIYGGLTRRDTENFIEGELITSSSRVLSVLDLEANFSVVHAGALWSFDAGISRGVPWLGAVHDPSSLPGEAPRAQFEKLTFGASVAKSFEPLGVRTQLSSALSMQWSNDVLYASEQMALAGPFSVRGYRDVRVYGDRGLTLRNELAFPMSFGAATGHAVVLRPFVGLDYGKLWAHEETSGGYLSGWAVGLTAAWSPLSLQLSWSGAGPRSDHIPSDHMFFARFAVSL